MHRARPGKKLIEGSCDSFVAMRIVAGEEYWRVVLAGVAQGCPIEISRAIRGETKAFATSEYCQIYGVLLAVFGCGKGFCFATDGAGNFYWTPLSDTRQHDAPVFFACHDPHGNERVAASLDEFLSWPRTMHAPKGDATA